MAVTKSIKSRQRSPGRSSARKKKFDWQTFKSLAPRGEYLFFLEATLEDFYALEEEKAEFLADQTPGNGGTLVMHSPASVKHERAFRDLFTEMHLFTKDKNSGEVLGSKVTVVLGNHRFEPDIIFIAKNNPGKFSEIEFLGVPDLVVEIISQGTRAYDLKIKREIYQQHKIKEIYFIDYLNKALLIDVLESDHYVQHRLNEGAFESRALEGFKIKCF